MLYQTQKLKDNPCVYFVDYSQLELTVDFRIRLFEEWKANGQDAGSIADMLSENGFDDDTVGAKYPQMLSKNFESNGFPVADRFQRSADGYEEKDPLILSGAFEYSSNGNGNGITLSAEMRHRLSEGYPAHTAEEILMDAGLDLTDVGKTRMGRIEKEARQREQEKLKESMMVMPVDTSGMDENELRLKKVRDNPYVFRAEFRGSNIKPEMTQRFYEEAYLLLPLGIDRIMKIYGIDPDFISRTTLNAISSKILGYDPVRAVPGRKPGPTPQVLKTGFARADAMHRLIEIQFVELGKPFNGLKINQKRRICRWIDSLPRDPQGYYTKEKILDLMRIKRSTYYEILENENYGMSEQRLADQDELDFEVIQRVIEYKGFEKGIRQIYMLMPRITYSHMSMNRIRRIMRRYGLRTTIRRPHGHRKGAREMVRKNKKANLLLQKFRLHRPNEVRLTDVTYLDYGNGQRAYGSCSVDPVSGMLIAFVVSEKNDLQMALDTLDEMDRHPAVKGAILHSDQGTLYMADDFQKAVKKRGYRQSMSKRGYCWDNAPEESFHGHFKDECHYKECSTIEELRELVDKYAVYYNTERGRWDHDGMTPAEYEKYLLDLDDEAFSKYLEKETARYEKMKADAAARAVEKAHIEQEEHRRQMEEYDVEQTGKE